MFVLKDAEILCLHHLQLNKHHPAVHNFLVRSCEKMFKMLTWRCTRLFILDWLMMCTFLITMRIQMYIQKGYERPLITLKIQLSYTCTTQHMMFAMLLMRKCVQFPEQLMTKKYNFIRCNLRLIVNLMAKNISKFYNNLIKYACDTFWYLKHSYAIT